MPVWIDRATLADRVELRDVRRVELPAEDAEVLAQLRFIARADDDARDRRSMHRPVQRDLRHGPTRLQRHLLECIDEGRLQPDALVTHRLSLEEAATGYRLFDTKDEQCRKVILTP